MNRPAQPTPAPGSERSTGADRSAEPEAEPERKQIYLRTLYPLNPGIPHYLDNPAGW